MNNATIYIDNNEITLDRTDRKAERERTKLLEVYAERLRSRLTASGREAEKNGRDDI